MFLQLKQNKLQIMSAAKPLIVTPQYIMHYGSRNSVAQTVFHWFVVFQVTAAVLFNYIYSHMLNIDLNNTNFSMLRHINKYIHINIETM